MNRSHLSQQPAGVLHAGAQAAARSAARGIREFADEYSRAQQVAALAAAGHRYPARRRSLAVDHPELRSPPLVVPDDEAAIAAPAPDLRRGQIIAMRLRCAAMLVVLGLIALIAHAS